MATKILGAYKILDNAKKCADQNPGYKVFDADGKVVYEPKAPEPAMKVPFLVKVSISDLNIRKGPGTDTAGCSSARLVSIPLWK